MPTRTRRVKAPIFSRRYSDMIGRLHDEIDELNSQIAALEDDVKELEDSDCEECEDLTIWVKCNGYSDVLDEDDAQAGLQILYDIGLDCDIRLNLVQVEEIRLAIERILR